MEGPSSLYPKKIDLTNCDREPIHLLGKVQPHGMLLVLSRDDLKIRHVSDNTFDFFLVSKDEMLSSNLLDLLGNNEGKRLENCIVEEHQKPLEISLKGKNFVSIIQYTKFLAYIEFEPLDTTEDNQIAQFQLSQIISELSGADSVEVMCEKTAVLIKDLLGYERVMLYKFDRNWNGQIVAESREEYLESWLGMHYPATDIPQQARKLFLKQGVRIIADVYAGNISIYPELDDRANPLDIGQCELRAVSPIHIEYLKNMGVAATLTAAIVRNGTLWGLIACHHNTPKFVNFYKRLSIKLLTQVFSNQITLQSSNEVLGRINDTASKRSLLVEQMSQGWEIGKGLTQFECTMLDMNGAKGGAVYIDGEFSTIGDVPSRSDTKELIDWIYETQLGDVYSTENLEKDYENGCRILSVASGVLCLFISTNKKDCLLWFKPELKQIISWGGNPEKAVENDGVRISPRKSFDRWNREQVGTSLPWLDYEIASASALRDNIANIIISRYAEVKKINDKLQLAYKDLESFSYSVSHDLRAPLRGIDGFAQIIKEDYFDSLDDYGKSSIQRIIDTAKKMDALIDDILSFSSLGREDSLMSIFSMLEAIKKSIVFLQVDILYPNTEIEIDETIPMAYGDQGMILQLLNNLIGNALKYSQKVASPKVKIGVVVNSRPPIYFVQDNGIGFNSAYAERIFGVFNRLVKEGEYEGSGIGLAIAKSVIDKHQGSIWAESEEGQGATFYFKLPVR